MGTSPHDLRAMIEAQRHTNDLLEEIVNVNKQHLKALRSQIAHQRRAALGLKDEQDPTSKGSVQGRGHAPDEGPGSR